MDSLLANLNNKGVRVQEGRNGATQMVSYPGYPGFSGKVNFMSGGSLVPCVVVLLVAVIHTFIQDGCLRKWMPWQ